MASTENGNWGRVLICGGTDWTKLGKKDTKNAAQDEEEHPDLPEPYILRSLVSVKIRAIHTSCHAVHFVCISTGGDAFLFGRNTFGCLGLKGGGYVSENAPMRLTVKDLGGSASAQFVYAGMGRNHTLLVDSEGTVWATGANSLGQCGIGHVSAQVGSFKQVQGLVYEGEKEKAIMASCGVTFSTVLCESGRVYSFGSAEAGQLGHGSTGERIITGNKTAFDVEERATLIRTLLPVRVTSIACGNQHTIALTSEGLIYVWGYGGYCRLGLANQVDQLRPKLVEQFLDEAQKKKDDKEGSASEPPVRTGTARFIAAGPSTSAVVDKGGMFYLAGKWKQTGEGSSGSPYTTFRFLPDIMACKALWASLGGVTHWISTPADSDLDPVAHPNAPRMVVAWGQNPVNSELGLGPDEPKSCTKPTRHEKLDGLHIDRLTACWLGYDGVRLVGLLFQLVGVPVYEALVVMDTMRAYLSFLHTSFVMEILGVSLACFCMCMARDHSRILLLASLRAHGIPPRACCLACQRKTIVSGALIPSSATAFGPHESIGGVHLDGVAQFFMIAAGAYTTLFLVNPSSSTVSTSPKEKKDGEDDDDDKYTNLPRWPDELTDTTDACVKCKKDSGDPLECDKCANPYHLQCLSPPLESVPEGEWFCPQCAKDPTGPIRGFKAPKYHSNWNGEEDEGAGGGKKRKFGGGASGDGGKKKKSG
ncbi:hypothetical protein PQX77_011615 [Marasmius sp. AFHP31]|nr:hypothetical protein PQX77_011615 [Marasmius sp. AFHP31]